MQIQYCRSWSSNINSIYLNLFQFDKIFVGITSEIQSEVRQLVMKRKKKEKNEKKCQSYSCCIVLYSQQTGHRRNRRNSYKPSVTSTPILTVDHIRQSRRFHHEHPPSIQQDVLFSSLSTLRRVALRGCNDCEVRICTVSLARFFTVPISFVGGAARLSYLLMMDDLS